MKDLFKVHARRIHLMSAGKCPLTMKIANINQGIEILELFQAILPRLNPTDCSLSTELQNKLAPEEISWSLRTRPALKVECELLMRSAQEHNDMYFVRIYDIDGYKEQAFFNHLSIHDVMARLKKLISNWKKELEKASTKPEETFVEKFVSGTLPETPLNDIEKMIPETRGISGQKLGRLHRLKENMITESDPVDAHPAMPSMPTIAPRDYQVDQTKGRVHRFRPEVTVLSLDEISTRAMNCAVAYGIGEKKAKQ